MDYDEKAKLEKLKHDNNLIRDRERSDHRIDFEQERHKIREKERENKRNDQQERTKEQREYSDQIYRDRLDERREYSDRKEQEKREFQHGLKIATGEHRIESEKIRAGSAETLEQLRQNFSEREIQLLFEDYKKRGDFDHNLYLQRLQAEMQAGVMEHMMKQFIDLQVWKTKQLFSYLIRKKEQEALTDGQLNDILRGIELH